MFLSLTQRLSNFRNKIKMFASLFKIFFFFLVNPHLPTPTHYLPYSYYLLQKPGDRYHGLILRGVPIFGSLPSLHFPTSLLHHPQPPQACMFFFYFHLLSSLVKNQESASVSPPSPTSIIESCDKC